MSNYHPEDGKHVVVQGGKRVSGNVSQQEAEQEAKRQNAIREGQGQAGKAAPPSEVKQNLYG